MKDKHKIKTNDSPSTISSQNKLRKNIFVVLSGIGIIGFSLRLYYLPYEIPIELDAIEYFAYSFFLSQNNQFPITDLPNNGWPTFLSVFFMSTNPSNFFDLVNIQRLVSISLSVLTIIPIYLICKEYFDYRIALLGSAIFCFEPRIIANSILGVSEPLFIFLGSLTLACILNKNPKLDYAGFFVAALFTLVRYEGILILIPLSIFWFVKNKKNVSRYLILITIFLIVLFPMSIIRIDTMGYDGISSHIFGNTNYITEKIILGLPDPDDELYYGTSEKNNPLFFLSNAIKNYIIYFGLVTIPIFILFIFLTIFYMSKNKIWKKLNRESLLIISFFVIMSIPAFFAFGRGIQETRYLYMLYPFLCVISLYGINQIFEKISKKRILILIITGILFSSIIFLEYKKIDYEHQKESFEISKKIIEIADKINSNAIDGSYLTVVSVMNNIETNSSIYESRELVRDIIKIPVYSFQSLDNIIESEELTHIVLDENNEPSFLNDVFFNEEKYNFLKKVFDSKESGYKYHVKIFQINYDDYYEFIENERNF